MFFSMKGVIHSRVSGDVFSTNTVNVTLEGEVLDPFYRRHQNAYGYLVVYASDIQPDEEEGDAQEL